MLPTNLAGGTTGTGGSGSGAVMAGVSSVPGSFAGAPGWRGMSPTVSCVAGAGSTEGEAVPAVPPAAGGATGVSAPNAGTSPGTASGELEASRSPPLQPMTATHSSDFAASTSPQPR